MFKYAVLSLIVAGCLLRGVAQAEPDVVVPPIQAIDGVTPNADIFKAAKHKDPVVIRSSEEAAKYFAGDSLVKLEKQVVFADQVVLVFAWKGSGGDQLMYDIAESYPEQIHFRLIPGLTRDLRPHIHVFALRSNVTWKVR